MPHEKLKIGIYSPYFSILGGGERFLLSIASYLSSKHSVTLFIDKESLVKAEELLHISLKDTSCASVDSLIHKGVLGKVLFLKKFDTLFYMTDGSLFSTVTKKNFLIIQSPAHIPQNTFLNRIKLKNWKIICYSKFMHDIILRYLSIKSNQLHPPVDPNIFEQENIVKRNIISSVGRFFKGLHDKKQEVLIDFFIQNYKKEFLGWELHVAGGLTEESGIALVKKLRKKSLGYPVKIHTNISFVSLVNLYKRTKIYWHAAGFGENLDTHPERAEHFGITTIEAMAAGAVPIVFKGGGQEDILENGKNGFFWTNKKELIEKTIMLMKNEELLKHFSANAKKRANDFSPSFFYEKLEKIIS